MFLSQMRVQISSCIETFSANLTFVAERLFVVFLYMVLETGTLGKGMSTLWTLERGFIRVHPHMLFEVTDSHPTLWTFLSASFGVNNHVCIPMAGLGEAFSTYLAFIRPSSSVNDHVRPSMGMLPK